VNPANLLFLAPMAPLLAAVLALGAPLTFVRGALIAAAIPGVLAGLLAGGQTMAAPGLLFGMQLGLDAALGPAMAAVAAVWGLAALHGSERGTDTPVARRYALCFALAMAGQMGAFVAHDLATFYAAFACLSFAGYGLVAQAGSAAALRAARIYLGFVVVGELALFAAFVLIAQAQGGALPLPGDTGIAPPALAWWLLAAGFGVKAGIVPLHAWLPLAHPVAPVPASAALSGATLKAGLVGLMGLAPVTLAAPQGFGLSLMGLGLLGAYGGALFAVLQKEVKTTLAWSSVSQMGLATALFGAAHAGLADPAQTVTALGLFIVAHALAKAALFLGVAPGIARRASLALLLLPALSLTGAPLTFGYSSKAAAGAAITDSALKLALDIAAYGTALAMARALVLLARRDPGGRAAERGAALTTLVLMLGILPLLGAKVIPSEALALAKAAAPALVAALLGWLVLRSRATLPPWLATDPMAPYRPFAALLGALANGVEWAMAGIIGLQAEAASFTARLGDHWNRDPKLRPERRIWRDAALAMAVVGAALLATA
jgi:formate hydrogenlyase subunit 3/multisubunit Na+/H+ antiporter MnhD subunit